MTWIDQFAADGFHLHPDALTAHDLASLLAAAETARTEQSAGTRRPELRAEAFTRLATSGIAADVTRALLGPAARPVRMILFDKTPEFNWHVAWHQDPCIAVKARAEVPGFTGWSVKAGIPHVQPPAEVLAAMVTLRFHLDDTPATNGALWVIPGSHANGRIPETDIPGIVAAQQPVICAARAGDVLVMQPLLLHASQKSTDTLPHRRIVHIEYSATELPAPLEWYGIG